MSARIDKINSRRDDYSNIGGKTDGKYPHRRSIVRARDVFWIRPGGETLIDVRGTARIEFVPSGNISWIDSVSVQMGSERP